MPPAAAAGTGPGPATMRGCSPYSGPPAPARGRSATTRTGRRVRRHRSRRRRAAWLGSGSSSSLELEAAEPQPGAVVGRGFPSTAVAPAVVALVAGLLAQVGPPPGVPGPRVPRLL